jgi:hypothetical protein
MAPLPAERVDAPAGLRAAVVAARFRVGVIAKGFGLRVPRTRSPVWHAQPARGTRVGQ